MRRQFLLTDIPRDLRDALELRARTEGTSVANVVGGILSARYRLKFSETSRSLHNGFRAEEYVRPNGQSLGLTINLRLPPAVLDRVRIEAQTKKKTQRSIVLETLGRALNVRVPKSKNRNHGRPRGRKVSVR